MEKTTAYEFKGGDDDNGWHNWWSVEKTKAASSCLIIVEVAEVFWGGNRLALSASGRFQSGVIVSCVDRVMLMARRMHSPCHRVMSYLRSHVGRTAECHVGSAECHFVCIALRKIQDSARQKVVRCW